MSRTVILADAAASVRDLVKALLEREDLVFVDEILLKPIDGWKLVAAAESALGPERDEAVEYPTPIARGA